MLVGSGASNERYPYNGSNNKISFKLTGTDTVTVTCKNTVERGNLRIIKVNKNNQNDRLEGFQFTVQVSKETLYKSGTMAGKYLYKDSDGTFKYGSQPHRLETDANGEIYIPNIWPAQYTITEVGIKNNSKGQENYGYEVDPSITKTVTVKPKGLETVKEVTIKNENHLADLRIIKKDLKTGKRLKDVEFTIYMKSGKMQGNYIVGKDAQGDPIYSPNRQTVKTDENGEIYFNNVWIGTCEIIEVYNPHYGYNHEPNVTKTVELKNKGTGPIEVAFDNECFLGDLTIRKDGTPNGEALPGIKFKLKEKTKGYVVGITESNKLTSVTGSVKFTNMEYVQDESQGTTFITDNSGNIKIEQILEGDYEIIEIESPYYKYAVEYSGAIRVDRGEQATENAHNPQRTTDIIVDKIDADVASLKLEGVKFKVKSSNGQYVVAHDDNGPVREVTGKIVLKEMSYSTTEEGGTTFITDSNGHLEIIDLLEGNYELIETEIPHYGYEATFKDSFSAPRKKTKTDGIYEEIKNEKQTGNLKIVKKDTDCAVPLEGIIFKIKGEQGYIIAHNKNGPVQQVTGSIFFEGVSYTNDITQATSFITDSNGQIGIFNIWKGTYEVIEYSVGDNFSYDVDPEYITWDGGKVTSSGKSTIVEIHRQSAAYTTQKIATAELAYENSDKLSIYNRKKYIKISGHVWEDMGWEAGKTNGTGNDLYKDDNLDVNDKDIKGIEVRLIGGSTGTKVVTTDSEGKYIFADPNDKVLINDIPNMYIQFEYNGMCYENVLQHLDKDNGSKAIEGSRRSEFNNKFSIITEGISADSSGRKTNDLSYDTSKAHTSKLLYGNPSSYNYGYPENVESGKPITGVDSKYLITALTRDAYNGNLDKIKTPEQIRKEHILELKNINLGIRKRKDVDLSLMKDLESVRVSINGAEHVYKYEERFNSTLFYDSEGNSGFRMDPAVKFGQESGRYGAMKYTRALYPSDIKYDGRQGGNELEVTVTYRIGIENTSTDLTAKVNEISDYYDEKYNFKGVGKNVNADGSVVGDTSYRNGSGAGKYQRMIIKPDMVLEPLEQQYIYVELNVKPEALNRLINKEVDVVEIDNVAEIYSYSAIDGNSPYAAIDIDSQPGNVDVRGDTVNNSYEDDTDKAPGLRLILQEERKISGKVFLDNIEGENTAQLMTGQIRQGNGIYNEGEKGIEGVEVKLVKADTGETAQHCMDRENWTDVTATTDENGEFTMEGFVPDEYELVYTWGDKTYRVQNYKSTIVKDEYDKRGTEGNLEWYKNVSERDSDAVDNYNTRKNIDNQSRLMKNNNKVTIDTYEGEGELELVGGGTEKLITKMDARTPRFKINVEYYGSTTIVGEEGEKDSQGNAATRNHLRNIDFGIAERPRQAIELSKFIKDARATLANGTVLIDTEIGPEGLTNNADYAVYLPKINGEGGQLKFEVDSEIIEGSELSIEYGLQAKNISELDYLTEEFYKYGKGHEGDENSIVTLNIEKINDYLDENVHIETDEELLKTTVDKNKLISEHLVETTNQMNKFIKDRNTVVLVSNKLSKDLRPTDTAEITFKVSRLLANMATTEISIENYAEIVQTNKSGGSTLQSTPGNYIPRISGHETDDSEAEAVTVVPPTGENLNYTPFVLIAITLLGVTSIGIILIKKYILK